MTRNLVATALLKTTLLFAILIHTSEATCEMFKKSVTIYRVERVLYKYVACVNITPDTDLRSEILSTVNSSSQYLEITNSTVPEITKDMFQSLNLTQITIVAKVQLVQERAFERSNISTIVLDNNEVKRLKPNAFKSFAIYVLSLKNNSLSEITSDVFVGLANLRKLNLQHNVIASIQLDAFNDLASLNELNLAFNQLKELPQALFDKLGNLQTLYLNNNYLKQLPVDIFTNNNILQYVSVQSNYLNRLDATNYPHSLLFINAAENHLNFFNVSGLVNLNRVILDNNKLTTTKNCLNELPSLGYLHLNHNFLGDGVVNESFGHLTNLSIVEIDNNRLRRVDFDVFNGLMQLEGMSLAENNLTRLEITQVSGTLKLLNLSTNSLTEMKNLWKLSQLVKLELSYNNFEVITFDMFANLSNLQHLWIHHNSIEKLHLGCFKDLKSLNQLDLSHNKITNISSGILNGLNKIIELDISYNNLIVFDEDIFHNTKNLRSLNIAFNKLNNADIKRVLSHTIWLREMNLNGNEWTCKLLIDIVHDNKIVSLVGGDSFNVSNVYGIPCNDSETINLYDEKSSLPEILVMMNATVRHTEDVSVKLNIVNTILIIFLVLICCKFVYAKFASRVIVAKQFLYQKSENEHEIQLL